MPGPAPKPTAKKLLDGTRKDRINRAEPKGKKPSTLAPPKSLDAAGAEQWRRMVSSCDPNLIQAADLSALELYCQTWSSYQVARADVEANGHYLKTDDSILVNPSLYTMRHDRNFMLKVLAEFGFTPASRTKVQVPENESSFDEFLKGFGRGN